MQRWHWTPISLVSSGVAVVWLVAALNVRALGWWELPLILGGAAALATIYWLRRQLSAAEEELEVARRSLAEERIQAAAERRELDTARKEAERIINGQVARLDAREQALSERFVTFHEWLEYPQPIDLRKQQSRPMDDPTDLELSELVRKDRKVVELLQAETKVVFEYIVNNRYSPDGVFNAAILREDTLDLITRVARIYNPELEQPLLETSLAKVIRAASRASLHFLAQIDELPLNVKDQNIGSLYGYIRQGVNAYKTYKSAEPYFSYANAAWYLGRLALGANPLTLGAWWFLGSVGKESARAVATHLVNRQALGLLGNLIRVIGYEVAGLYGGDFRRRDANWIYGAELTDLVSRFPLSRDSLSHSLKEVGALQLRSEYDRVYLYRCLASQKSADPGRWRATVFLSGEERRAIAARLEKFCDTFIHGLTPAKIGKWQTDVESRLGIRMHAGQKGEALDITAQREDALRSLAGFLISLKEREPDELPGLLSDTKTYRSLDEANRTAALAAIAAAPAYFFEQPNVDPHSPVAEPFLQDLASLQVRTTPRSADLDSVVADTAAYLRREPKETQLLLDQEYIAHILERLHPDAPTRKVTAPVARAALDLVLPGEYARFLYGGITLEPGAKPLPAEWEQASLWLLGAGDRLVLFTAAPQPQVVWKGELGKVELEQANRVLRNSATLRGGEWIARFEATPSLLRLSAPLLPSPSYFKPLAEFLEAAPPPA